MNIIPESELILNQDGSVYHLQLLPEDISDCIITVGDQDRVAAISKYFDTLEVQKQNREFKTHTGSLNGKRLTVISTGIGPDNIDIVMNELDALVNIDLVHRRPHETHQSLEFIRIGTSGGIQADVAVDSFIVSAIGLGFDNLIHFYKHRSEDFDIALADAFARHTNWNPLNSKPYAVHSDQVALSKFVDKGFAKGITATNVGFYGPQGRTVRLALQDEDLNSKIGSFSFENQRITNLEMETAAIYGMSKLLGHKAISLNAILANRLIGTFSKEPAKTVDKLIQKSLEIITE